MMDDKQDNLIKEYENRPQMWDPAVVRFQDRAYLLAAKREIAKKFQWENGMTTYTHTYTHIQHFSVRLIYNHASSKIWQHVVYKIVSV